MINIHRIFFVAMAFVAFMQGAVNAGRADLLSQYQAKVVMNLTLNQLTNLDVGI